MLYKNKLTVFKEEHMKKFLKITLLAMLLLFITYTFIYAINMDLSNNANISNTEVENNAGNSAVSENDIGNNSVSNLENNISNNSLSSANSINNNNQTPNISTNVSTNYQETTLGLSEYLNIAIIVIGVLLILLAVAILIRLKN